MADVHDVVAIAVGGREAGLVFEGDRRFDIIVRLPETVRNDVEALETLPVPLPRAEQGRILLTTVSRNPERKRTIRDRRNRNNNTLFLSKTWPQKR